MLLSESSSLTDHSLHFYIRWQLSIPFSAERFGHQGPAVCWIRLLRHCASQSLQMLEYSPAPPEQDRTKREFRRAAVGVEDSNSHPEPWKEYSVLYGFYVFSWQRVMVDTYDSQCQCGRDSPSTFPKASAQ